MPATVRKLPNRSRWRVRDGAGRITARATSKRRARAQAQLLRGIAHGWLPTAQRPPGWRRRSRRAR